MWQRAQHSVQEQQQQVVHTRTVGQKQAQRVEAHSSREWRWVERVQHVVHSTHSVEVQ